MQYFPWKVFQAFESHDKLLLCAVNIIRENLFSGSGGESKHTIKQPSFPKLTLADEVGFCFFFNGFNFFKKQILQNLALKLKCLLSK